MDILKSCQHRLDGWCSDCVQALIEGFMTSGMETPFKPCPFCGDNSPHFQYGDNHVWLECSVCKQQTRAAFSEQQAVEGWNERAEKYADD